VRAELPQGAGIVVLGPSALPLARRLQRRLPGAEIHVAQGGAIALLKSLFRAGHPIVGICAAGIVIRALAPLLKDKTAEPPVVAVAEDGSVAVPLLGGHHGANAMARAIARATGGTAALTTASELRLGLTLDEPPTGWRVANPARAKALTARLLADGRVTVRLEAGTADWLTGHPRVSIVETTADIRVTDRVPGQRERALVLHPPVLALGVGASRHCPPAELAALVRRTLGAAKLAPAAIGTVVSIDLKMDEPAVTALAERLGAPARFFPASRLLKETPRLQHPSAATFRATGCYGVAEGAALAAVGRQGVLVVAKRKSRNATCAIARAPQPLDPGRIGRARGSLAIVGIGPGDAAWRTPEASAALTQASDVVGYRLYLDLLGDALRGKRRHALGLGAETDRARLALDLAAQGRAVALVSSGDAGIYGLASLVFELVDREERPDWRRLRLGVVPGVSALQAAAARVGAPLGHDFAAISLSDLLTPWATIERRLAAAARGDFVLALYNPRSQRRTRQLEAARRILLRHRPPDTPVVLARNLGRAGEQVSLGTLARFEARAVDMLTLVLVGSRATRVMAGDPPRLYTPRGYRASPT
jgi:cobalt-precorrin 5A hydrolase / cobalt-factor III methyltransferase / precorrin-3B C17-methyltransferase